MKKLVLIAVFLLGFSMMAMAADAPAVEIFGGYSFIRADTTAAFDIPDGTFNLNMNGWDASIAFNANKWAGFVVDIGGAAASPSSISENLMEDISNVDMRTLSFMVGPRFSVRKGKVTPFAQALFGYAHVVADFEGENVFRENDFAMAFGAGLDVNIGDWAAVRPVQVECLSIRSGETGNFSKNFRYSTGIVVKIGKR